MKHVKVECVWDKLGTNFTGSVIEFISEDSDYTLEDFEREIKLRIFK